MNQHLAARRGLLGAGLGLAAGAVRGAASEDPFPTGPVRLVVPYPERGATDVGTRILAPALSDLWGQPVRVENRAGMSGTIGAEYVAHAPPDGNVLLMGSLGVLAINPTVVGQGGHDVSRELVPISLVADLPMVLVASPSLGVRSVGELVAVARARPGQLTYGSSGLGHSRFVAAELFKYATRTDIRAVQLRCGGPLLVELRAGRIDLAFMMLLEASEGLRQRWLQPLALSGPMRLPMLPGTPTLAETVAPGFNVGNWIGLLAPEGTPPERVGWIVSGVHAALARPDIVERFVEAGGVPSPSSPALFAEFIGTERARYTALLRRRGITIG